MQRLILFAIMLFGPCLLILLAALYLARRFFPEMQVLFELSESMLVFAAGVIAFALAGLLAQVF